MIYEGKLNGSGLKIGIVAARFNEFIVSKLVSGAEDCLYRHDVAKEDVEVAWVPGAFEIPVQKDQKLTVCQHEPCRIRFQKFLHILR